MVRVATIAAVVILLSFSSMAMGATYYVPDNFTTIQAALDAAGSGYHPFCDVET